MKAKRPAKWNQKKIRLLKVAQQVFARFGYAKTTMEDIAGAMNMKKGSLYYYYKNKEEILREVVLFESEQYLTSLRKKLSRLRDPREKIQTMLKIRLEKLQEIMNLHNISIQAFLETEEIIRELHKECFEKEAAFIAEIITEGIHLQLFRPVDPLRVANSILTYAEAVKYREFHRNRSRMFMDLDYSSIQDEIQFTVDLILDGLIK